MTEHHPITAIAVGVPARNEALRVAVCIESIDRSAALVSCPVHLVVVDDGSGDSTAENAMDAVARATHLTGAVISLACGSAGAARSAAINAALRATSDTDHTWISTTDADTVVGEGWLSNQLAWAAHGYGAISGLVDVEWEPGTDHLESRYRASLGSTSVGHAHVHGANLGLLARHWIAVGGCGDAADGEDHELWRRLRAIGVSILGVNDLPVSTSGRLSGRAPHGFSGYLRSLASAPYDPTPLSA